MRLASLALMLFALTATADVPFEHVVVDTEYFGDCKSIGDMNDDGLPDLLLANRQWLLWYEAPNWTRHIVNLDGENYTTDMELGDMDGDGDSDIIVPDGQAGKLQWFENPRTTGDPTQGGWKAHLVGTHGDYVHDLEIADLGGDKKPNIVTRPKGTQIYIWEETTPERWEHRVLTCPPGEGLAVGDLNADGFPDILVAGRWYEGSKAILDGKWTEHVFARWDHPDTYVRADDINGDGREDIVLTPSEGTFRMAWFEAPVDAVRGEWTEHVIQETMTFTHSIELGDMDMDGDLDIVVAEMEQSDDPDEVLIFFNEGGAGLQWNRQVVATTGSHNLRIGDLDADDDPDIYGSNWQDPPVGRVEFWRNGLRSTKAELPRDE